MRKQGTTANATLQYESEALTPLHLKCSNRKLLGLNALSAKEQPCGKAQLVMASPKVATLGATRLAPDNPLE